METRYQVFVSSTFVDLIEERRAVMQSLLSIDCMPAGMELFPAADDSAWGFIESMIAQSDYYVLVIGGRYGSRTQDNSLSYTHREYKLALKLGLPILAFLHADPGKIPLEKSDMSEDARVALESFRQEVASRHIINYFTHPFELASKVMQAIRFATRAHPRVGWIRADQAPQLKDSADVLTLRDRDSVDSAVGSVRTRLQRAQRSIFVSGNNCKLIESNRRHLKEAIDRGVEVKVLCVDPDGIGASILPLTDPAFDSVQSFKDSMISVKSAFASLEIENPLFEIRYLPFPPSIGFFIVDPTAQDGLVKIEIYTSKPYGTVNSRPHIILNSDERWRSYFLNQWENLWNLGYQCLTS